MFLPFFVKCFCFCFLSNLLAYLKKKHFAMVYPVLLIIYVTTNNHGWCQQQKEIYILWICFQQGLLMIADWLGAIHICTLWSEITWTEILYNKAYEWAPFSVKKNTLALSISFRILLARCDFLSIITIIL